MYHSFHFWQMWHCVLFYYVRNKTVEDWYPSIKRGIINQLQSGLDLLLRAGQIYRGNFHVTTCDSKPSDLS